MVTRRKLLRIGALTGAGLLSRGALRGQVLAQQGAAAPNNTVYIPGVMRPPTDPYAISYAAKKPPTNLLPGSAIAQFVDPLPDLEVIVDTGAPIELHSSEFQAQVLPSTFVPQGATTYSGTWVWGYLQPGQTGRATSLGPVIVATRGQPTEIRWVNDLGMASTTNVAAYRDGTDQTLHWANPLGLDCGHPMMGVAPTGDCALHYTGPIPDVTHLHGGEVPPQIDGGPDSWYTSDGIHGPAYYTRPGSDGPTNSAVYRYPNSQEAAAIWFHPHPLGTTRLNVIAGLAGGYLIVDPNLGLPANLPGPADIVPLVIQDRMFDVFGQLVLPNVGLNPEHPYWVPEFVGDAITVNGKTWPYKNVERKRYRFVILNGSNARPYELSLVDPVTKVKGPPLWVIGTDGGYLDTPIKIDPNVKGNDRLLVLPGERYEVIIDFGDPAWLATNPAFSGTLIMQNSANTPYPKGAPPQGATLGRIVKFIVGAAPAGGDPSYNPVTDGPLRTDPLQQIVRLPGTPLGAAIDVTPATGNVQVTRQFTLNEVMGMGGPLEVLVNNTKWNGERMDPVTMAMTPIPGSTPDGIGNYLTELPKEGDTEVWEIVNLTADAHPIHLHLVQYQIINRQGFNLSNYNLAYVAAFPGMAFIGGYGPPLDYATGNPRAVGGNPDVTPFLQGPARPPAPQEAGWKDTAVMMPGEVTRIVVRWAPTGLGTGLDPAEYAYPFDPSGADYVWHCHIIDHEDNEMMRPDAVVPRTDALRFYDPTQY